MIEFKHRRPLVAQVHKALRGDIPFLHIIIGPRQVGKTTAAQQVAAAWGGGRYSPRRTPLPPGPEWIHAQWENAFLLRQRPQGPAGFR